jgi:hypothetical protein
MQNLNDVPYFEGRGFQRVPEFFFGEAVRMVIAEAGPMGNEEAMRIVEAVFGPLRLLSPVNEVSEEYYSSTCGHRYFRYEGGWRHCVKEHDAQDGDPHAHRNYSDDDECDDAVEYTEWMSNSNDDRAFAPKESRR